MRQRFGIGLLLLLLTATSAWGYKSEKIYVNSGGKQRNMLVYTPDVLPDNCPLFITTHGMGGNSENQAEHDRMYELVDTAKFVMCYPRADGDYWDISGTKDQNFIIKVIDEMAARYNINRKRVYWSGFSMGSMLLFHCMPNMLDKIAAFAPTSGIQFSESPWERCSKKVNVMECIAYNDNAFNYSKYGIRSYMEHFGQMNQYTKYEKVTGYRTQNGTS
jgi:poly(3-hydroxybutyrate) depolymerase